jgi:hypothetical protein
MTNARMRLTILLTCMGMVLGSTMVALGQDRGGSRGSARAETEAAAPEDEATDDATDEATEDEDDLAAAESDIVEVDGQKVKVFRFSGLDISGRLKSPQLLYFLNRLRAEFDRPRLPHRSFMPELERSAKGKAFR